MRVDYYRVYYNIVDVDLPHHWFGLVMFES